MEQPDRHESRRERSFPLVSGSSPCYDGGLTFDNWEMSDDGMLHFDLVRILGRPTLPALEIVRKFAAERQQPNRELDFVLFLDADRAAGSAHRATVEEFCESVNRPRAFNE